MADTMKVHHPDRPGSTMTVTSKAYEAVYAREGFVRGVHGAAEVDAHDVSVLQQRLAETQRQLAEAQASASSPHEVHVHRAFDGQTLVNPGQQASESATPAKRSPRKRAPRKAAPAPVEMATGPADIGSTSELD